jgi:hypothetical protein
MVHFDADDLPRIAAADSRTIYAVDRKQRLVAIDTPSGERHVIAQTGAWRDALYALDADYLYFASAGIGRIRRDGWHEPEILVALGDFPQGFVVADGYAYFPMTPNGIDRCALVPGTASSRPRARRPALSTRPPTIFAMPPASGSSTSESR